MDFVYAVICWVGTIFFMVTIGRKMHYENTSNETYGQAVIRRMVTTGLFLAAIGFLLGALFFTAVAFSGK